MEHFPGSHQIMQAIHELLDTRVPVTPVAIKNVNVVRAQRL